MHIQFFSLFDLRIWIAKYLKVISRFDEYFKLKFFKDGVCCIFQDLQRTNSAMVTVNNLLQM